MPRAAFLGELLMPRLIPAALLTLVGLYLEVSPPMADAQQPPPPGPWHGSGKNGAVATGGQEAMEAGLAMLKSGGNAADAAAVATLVMTVTDPDFVCFGGEIPILFYDAKTQSVEVLCGQGAAPRLATREHFAKKGGIPNKGIQAATIPGTLDALLTLLDRHGTKTFAEVAAPALKLLDERNVPYFPDYAATLRRLI